MKTFRIAILGAGYIATWHADAIRTTPGLDLVAVCDASSAAAQGFSSAYGIQCFTDLEELIAAGVCDAVHILTPPPLHHPLARRCLEAGLHVLVEKPAALSGRELDDMAAAADRSGRILGVCHNFLALPSYQRLKAARDAGLLGVVSAVQINWSLPLPPLRSGPYGIWLLADIRNLLLELGPHPFSFAVDLFGDIEIDHVSLGQWITLPGGARRPQSWRILARAGEVEITIALSLVETVDDRSVTLRGSSGLAQVDYAADTFVMSRDNTSELVINPLRKELGKAGAHLREALVNAARQALSLNQKSPYGLSFRNTIAAFYEGLRQDNPDSRFTIAQARKVIAAIESSLSLPPELVSAPGAPAVISQPRPGAAPKIMVIGGTGFIGRNLTRRLVARGHDVRVVSRGRSGPFDDLAGHVELSRVSLHDEDALCRAMEGMDCVFNLARSVDRTWTEALENDVATALRISRAARQAGVRRMVYTGTIASYDMSDPNRVINEDTVFGEMEERNLYARSKAECERRLLEAQSSEGVDVTIARPGIVLGPGGPLQHWGIGRWHGPGAVRLWGSGRNILPFVLADDVSDGLIAMMETPGIEGSSFNLIGDPMLTGRDYFDEIHRRLGARIHVTTSDPNMLWAADRLKHGLKRYVLRRKDVTGITRADWKSRCHLSRFDNAKARRVLNWNPESDRERFLIRSIVEPDLFGVDDGLGSPS
ncbi:NAD-dependent epimerase/dehydratase family protein [Falsigemmobacter intermedius]|uniref:NAD-dependent epimerase/dehydratase family protein n=1 Tax=Falsigemmobacter intermedius TaxID=1553448 RepID=A0A451GGD0_9RHOB|nr:NAD-dependent epimerase/dehydratase family protein [Falsigemmobacter intermedius]RWY35062.1 NAD-dependent epimerase/dehydratase family protein [Falsigemmobacter intermedius]